MPRTRGRGRRRPTKRKATESNPPNPEVPTQLRLQLHFWGVQDATKEDKKKPAKKPRTRVKEAAIRPRTTEEGNNAGFTYSSNAKGSVLVTLYLRDLQVVYLGPGEAKPPHFVECVNFHKEDVFGHGGENLNKGFNAPAVYLVPIWTPTKRLANITGFELEYTEVEDPSQRSLTSGPPGRFVYLRRLFDPSLQDRIIGLQLFRSRKFNPPHYGWAHTTSNINEGRGGDNLSLQWDLGSDGDVPGYKYRFRRR